MSKLFLLHPSTPFRSVSIIVDLLFFPSMPRTSSHPSLLRVLRTRGIPLHRHPGLKEALSEMEKQGIISPFLFSTLANMLEGELEEGTADVVGCQEKALTVSVGS